MAYSQTNIHKITKKKKKMKTPLIKWTGSKRPIAKKIISFFPREMDCYYEPFLGGGSVFFELLRTNDIAVKKFRLSDKNESLINICKIVKDDSQELINSYRDKWERLQKDDNFFYSERDNYNKTKDPLIFYFLTRTCYNGTIRYNRRGEFNTSHHFGRTGMLPDKVERVIKYYSELMINRDIEFDHLSFEEIDPLSKRDCVYLDPPYTNTDILYFGNISLDVLVKKINNFECSWFMNINNVNSTDNEEKLNISYTGKELLSSGNSSFSRMKGKMVEVGEYFYYKLI